MLSPNFLFLAVAYLIYFFN